MICPKCGQEYMGDSCPYCEKPKVIVNNQEYLARKMEYERKQAGVKSASSSDAADSKDMQENMSETDKDVRPDEVFKKLVDKVNNAGAGQEDAPKRATLRKKKRSMLMKRLIITAAIAVLLFTGVFMAVRIIRNNSMTLYTSYNGKIYNVSGIDSKYVCDSDKAYFKADGKNFCVPDEPAEVSGKTVTERLASDSGRYFTSVVYDDSSKMYTLYLWSDSACYMLAKNTKSKSAVYVADDGTLVYKETEMINEVGGLGYTSLYITQLTKNDSDITPVTTQLSDNVRQLCVYSDEQFVIYNTGDDVLYSYCFGKNKTQTLIDTDVSALYPLEEDTKGCYSYSASALNSDKNVSTVVYAADGKAYIYDCLGKSDSSDLIDSAAGGVSKYIVNTNSGIYAVSASVIRYSAYRNRETEGYTNLISLGSTANIVYFSDRDIVVAVTSDGELKSLSKGQVRDITDGVAEGSLSVVNNTDTGIVYIRGNILYYFNIASSSELIVSESGMGVSTSDTLMYRNRLYYYDSSGKLCSCNMKGSDALLIGEVARFWLGR